MFAGIDDSRPWPAGGMTTARWTLEVPLRRIPIGDLIATQSGVHLAPLIADTASSHSGDPYPHVRWWNGAPHLEDGHHRVLRAALNGATHVTARLLMPGSRP